MIRLGLMLSTLALAACATQPAPKPAPTAGQVLTGLACSYRIASAEAWLNRMPGPADANRRLHVAIRLDKADDTALLIKSDDSTPEQLVLDIRGVSVSAQPGFLNYAEPIPKVIPKRISIRCRGAEIVGITDILEAV